MEVAKQKDLDEVLNQELDDKDGELAEMDDALPNRAKDMISIRFIGEVYCTMC